MEIKILTAEGCSGAKNPVGSYEAAASTPGVIYLKEKKIIHLKTRGDRIEIVDDYPG